MAVSSLELPFGVQSNAQDVQPTLERWQQGLPPEATQPLTPTAGLLPETYQLGSGTASATLLYQVEQAVALRRSKLPVVAKPFAEYIEPFLRRAALKEQLAKQSTGEMANANLSVAAAVMNEQPMSRQQAKGYQVSVSRLPEAEGKAAIVKAVAHAYIRRGGGITAVAAAGAAIAIPGAPLVASAMVAAHSALNIKTTIKDAGERAQGHVAQAEIRMRAIGTAGQDMTAVQRIKENLERAHHMKASTVKEIGVKVLGYVGAVMSPLGVEHQIARAGAHMSRMLSPDTLLAEREAVLAIGDKTQLLALSQRIEQSVVRGYVANEKRLPELMKYKQEIDVRIAEKARTMNADELRQLGVAKREQAQAITADLDARAQADAKWVAGHIRTHKLAAVALSTTTAVRMLTESALMAQGLASVVGVPNPTVAGVHAASLHGLSHEVGLQSTGQERVLVAEPKGPALINEGITTGHSQDFAIDVTPDGKSVSMFSLDHAGNAVMLHDGSHTYLIPFDQQGRLVLGHNGTVDAITENGTHVQLQQDDVLRYLGVDERVQKGLQQNGGILEMSGYRLHSRVAEVQYDTHTGQYHVLASTGGQAGGTLEPHSDHLTPAPQQSSSGTSAGVNSQHINPPSQSPTPSPTPSATPTAGPVLGPELPVAPKPSVPPVYPEQPDFYKNLSSSIVPWVIGGSAFASLLTAAGIGTYMFRKRKSAGSKQQGKQPPIQVVRASTPRLSMLAQVGKRTMATSYQKMRSTLVRTFDALQQMKPIIPSAALVPTKHASGSPRVEQQKPPTVVLDKEMEAEYADGQVAVLRTNVVVDGKLESLIVYVDNPGRREVLAERLRDIIVGGYRIFRTGKSSEQTLREGLANALNEYVRIASRTSTYERKDHDDASRSFALAGAMILRSDGSYILGTIPPVEPIWPLVKNTSDAYGYIKFDERSSSNEASDIVISASNGMQLIVPQSAPRNTPTLPTAPTP